MSISDNCTISLHFVTGFCCQAGQGQTQQADTRHRLVVLLSITGTHYPHTFSSLLHAYITFPGLLTGFFGQSGNISLIF